MSRIRIIHLGGHEEGSGHVDLFIRGALFLREEPSTHIASIKLDVPLRMRLRCVQAEGSVSWNQGAAYLWRNDAESCSLTCADLA